MAARRCNDDRTALSIPPLPPPRATNSDATSSASRIKPVRSVAMVVGDDVDIVDDVVDDEEKDEEGQDASMVRSNDIASFIVVGFPQTTSFCCCLRNDVVMDDMS